MPDQGTEDNIAM